MKDTETVTLDEILTQVAWYGSYKRSGEQPEGPTLSPDEAKAAIIKLFEQTVESARPELYEIDSDDPRFLYDSGYNSAIKEYEYNLLQALSNNGKAGE